MGWVTGKSWTAPIAAELNTTEYHNALITILDPGKGSTTWDIETNIPVTTDGASRVIARDIHARINWPLRSVADPGTTDYDPTTIRSGRVSIDVAEFPGPLRNGMQVIVTDGGQAIDLLRYRFRIAEALNSSWMASRVFKITVDAEAVTGNGI